MSKIIKIYKWNPWTGCRKYSEGCKLCSSSSFYPNYYTDITLSLCNFDLPLQRNKQQEYYIPLNSYVAVEFNSDFFLPDMDFYRPYLWNIIRARPDLKFRIVTKRIDRVKDHLPIDWGDGWDHVYLDCTAENQKQADYRLPIYFTLPLKHYNILTEPLIEDINLESIFKQYHSKIETIFVEGEFCLPPHNLEDCRPCNYKWVKHIADQCKWYNINFSFDLTGTKWINELGELILVPPYSDGMEQLAKATNLTTGRIFGLKHNDSYELLEVNKEER